MLTDKMERSAQIEAQREIGRRVRNGEKPTKEEIHKILEEKRKEVSGK